jgi:hypothetical protein
MSLLGGMKLTTRFHLMSKLKTSSVIPLFPQYAFMAQILQCYSSTMYLSPNCNSRMIFEDLRVVCIQIKGSGM